MKNRILNITTLWLFFILVFTACSKLDEVKNPLDGFKVIIDYDIFETFVSFRFIDTSTGELLGVTDGKNVVVTIGGEDQQGVVSQLGEYNNQYESFSAQLAIALNPKPPYVPSADDPFMFSISAEFDGYYTEILPLLIKETGSHSFDVYMERKDSQSGIKEFYREIVLTGNGEVSDSIVIKSKSKEFCLELSSGATFLDKNGEKVVNDVVKMSVKAYNTVASAPFPTSLITDVKENTSTKKMAVNPFNMLVVKLWTESGEISTIQNKEIELCLAVDQNIPNPTNWKRLNDGDLLKFGSYTKSDNIWSFGSEEIVVSEGNNKYIKVNISSASTYTGAILQNVCQFKGSVDFSSEVDAFANPVSLGLSCIRIGDNKFLGQKNYGFSQNSFSADYDFLVPENNRVKLSVVNRDNTNSFEATPNPIQVDSPCGKEHSLQVQLEPTSMEFQGAIRFRFSESFPSDQIGINVRFYDTGTGQLLLTQNHLVSDNILVDLSTSIKRANSLRIEYRASNGDNSFWANPSEIIVNNPLEKNQQWEVELTPERCLLSGNIDFNFIGSFGGNNIDFEVEVRDDATNSLIQSYFLQCSETNSLIPFSIVLPKGQSVYLKIKRVEGGTKFHVYPYEISIGDICQENLIGRVDISPVEMQLVNIHVLLTCPNAQIIPSFKGYYRLVWEDEWKETDIVYGDVTLDLELNGTYELGFVNDNELESREYKITGPELNLEFELNDEECEDLY